MTGENWERIGFDRREIKERQRRLARPGMAQKIMRVYGDRPLPAAPDVEAALYDAFLQDADRSRCASLQDALSQGKWLDLDYADRRLVSLSARLKSRSFAELLSEEERQDWHEFVRDKLNADDAPWLTLKEFAARLDRIRQEPEGDDPRRQKLLGELEAYAGGLKARYAG